MTAFGMRISDCSADVGSADLYRGLRTRLCVAEPTGMAFARAWHTRDHGARATHSTCIEGIGRPTAEPGFLFEVVDEVIEEIGRAHVGTPVNNAHIVCRLLLEKKKKTDRRH